jgi:hypothetical protein
MTVLDASATLTSEHAAFEVNGFLAPVRDLFPR